MSTTTITMAQQGARAIAPAVPGEQNFAEQLLDDAFVARLKQLAKEKASEYRTNAPFPNIYFDNFLPVDVAQAAVDDFPEPKQIRWSEFADENQVKLAFDKAEKLPASIRNILYFFNSRPMLEFLEELTGIRGLISDPYFVGGGVHQIKPGGFLEVHADFNRHTKLNLDRRLNVLLYLNQDWKEEYGGHFELWNKDMTKMERQILPLFNRLAMFSTTSTSYHGHPTPLSCPPDRARRSIAVYYYTNGRPEEEITAGHDTLFQEREGAAKSPIVKVKKIVRAITPPILMNAIDRKSEPKRS
jgi:Rps23 Pro-64 3,4-dihydroxylase Tpa1-like proline 4-hydroxylase